jgi:hypothetical protein
MGCSGNKISLAFRNTCGARVKVMGYRMHKNSYLVKVEAPFFRKGTSLY